MEQFHVTDFIRRFPIGEVISINDFDDWGIYIGEIKEPETEDKGSAEWSLLLKQRNNLRAAINKISTRSDMFLPEEKFSVEVHAYGESYLVKALDNHFADIATKLPSKVLRNFETKSKQIEILMNSTDLDQLPQELRVQVSLVGKSTRRLKRSIEFTLNEAQLELEEIFSEVRKHAEKIDGETNGGFSAIGFVPEDN